MNFDVSAAPMCIAFHPVGASILAVGYADGTAVIRLKQATVKCKVSESQIVSMAFSLLILDDVVGSKIAAFDGLCNVYIIDSTAKKLCELNGLPIHSGTAIGVKWNPNNSMLLCSNTKGFGESTPLKIFSTKKKKKNR